MKRYSEYFKFLGIAILGGLIAVGIVLWVMPSRAASTGSFQNQLKSRFAAYTPETAVDFTTAAATALPAVVHIKATNEHPGNEGEGAPSDLFRQFFGEGDGNPHEMKIQPQRSSGSGVIISADGYIVTNNHVVQDEDKLEVVLNDNRNYIAKVIGTDPSTDLALIKIEEKNLPTMKFGNSDDLKVGQWVLAVGNPFELTSTVTAGIVSAKGRNIGIVNDKNRIESFIQTDAAVNPGNSGGALITTNGELVGINTAIATPTGVSIGYSFAVPSTIVTKVMDDLLKFGVVQRGFLGIRIQDVDAELAEKEHIKTTQGVYVNEVNEKSAAKDAGIEKGDVILKINGIAVNTAAQLQEQVGQRRPGDKLKVLLLHKNEERTLEVTLKNQSGTIAAVKPVDSDLNNEFELGAQLRTLTADEQKTFKVDRGVIVSKLEAGKLRELQIREGFVITKVADQSVNSAADVKRILAARKQQGLSGALLEGTYGNGKTALYALVF